MISSSACSKIFTLSAIAIFLTLGGCNPFPKTSKTPNSATPTVVNPLPPSPWRQPQLLRSLDTDATPIVSITISPDNKTIAASSFSGQVKMWNLESGELTLEVKLGTEIRAIRFSPNSQTVASGDAERNVKLYDFAHRG